MGQADYSVFNKWKQVWEAGFLDTKHWSIYKVQNHLNVLRDRQLHWENNVPDYLVIFKSWLPLDNFDNAKWIQ